MGWNDRTKAAFDAARDSSKQVLTLTTAILTLSITFSDKIVGLGNLTDADKSTLRWAWAVFGVSMVFGIWTLLALTGSTAENGDESINDLSIRIPAIVQMLAFLAGVALFVVFGSNTV